MNYKDQRGENIIVEGHDLPCSSWCNRKKRKKNKIKNYQMRNCDTKAKEATWCKQTKKWKDIIQATWTSLAQLIQDGHVSRACSITRSIISPTAKQTSTRGAYDSSILAVTIGKVREKKITALWLLFKASDPTIHCLILLSTFIFHTLVLSSF